MTLLAEKSPVARRLHVCNLCGGRIDPNTTYRTQTWVDAGDFYTLRAHDSCLELAKWWVDQQWHDDFPGREEHHEAMGWVIEILCELLTPRIGPYVAAERPLAPCDGESTMTRARAAPVGM